MVEVESREELESKVGPQTAMMFFYNAADPLGQIHHQEFIDLGKKHDVPTLIDAAADVPPVENLWRYTEMGFDLVAFSGGKGMRGPQSSGLLLGRKDLIAAAKRSNSPNGDTLCRTNKVNKEEVIGMLVALESFLARDHAAVWKDWESRCDTIIAEVKRFADVQTEVYVPEIANAIPHLRIRWDYDRRKLTPTELAEKLRNSEPSIEVNPATGEQLVIGIWMMEPGEDKIVGRRIAEVLAAT
jgi:L-seryl-tRNA(Ser) seleniumtransferase